MNQQLLNFKSRWQETWGSYSTKTKWLIGGTFLVTLLLLLFLVFWMSKPNLTPIYSNLTPTEAGEIKGAIEQKGIPVEVSTDGTTISVPKDQASDLKVSLAAEGIPKSGNVNYSIFSENMGMGMTDRQFDVVERDAMQNELSYLIEQIGGIQESKVMITLPAESVWLDETGETASASIVLTRDPGAQLDQGQITGLYHLISKSVPNLPVENIVIMDQNGTAFDYGESGGVDTTLSAYQQQEDIRNGIEKDMQQELQQMLGMILGQDKVVVSVMASVDFTKEKRTEDLVEPVDEETGEGIDISVEKIMESYSGDQAAAQDGTGTDEGEIPNYNADDPDAQGDGSYEKVEDRINREVNRIHKEIEESPYLIDDITINVGVEPPVADDITTLTAADIEDIRTVLKNVVRTSLSESEVPLDDAALEERISVFANEFKGRADYEEPTEGIFSTMMDSVPAWVLYTVAGGVGILVIGGIFLLFRRRGGKEEDDFMEFEESYSAPEDHYLPREEREVDLTPETLVGKDEIESLAKNDPEEFVKLLRLWMKEE
ncbi:flagellar basal-body MS-ring/collar protein FliF [Pseudalkalibacillus hwajinpoensis]|uniref:flagellar basal-body MS-ring/collar protein FliF n=1 Tax=Guptibacillus hwajinpoensis TaxID=208199 RepID=UPI001CD43AB7|nr:flagellar basal-body MS-ring/collar protein FliF [Pseudalkalibacillus hwajinpoensis]MCA0991136.1 flagellar M-ring protein FliF [Pseudalkalibacillus hwajinpoensis]